MLAQGILAMQMNTALIPPVSIVVQQTLNRFVRRVLKVVRRILRWVCGCDGKSYQNTCMANSAGVGVLHEGQCEAAK